MKKKLIKLTSWVVTAGILMTLFCGVAMADGIPETTGSGTPDDPTVTTTTTTQTDAQTGETTVNVTIQKAWSDETLSGQEQGTFHETTDASGGLISADGNASGSETTVKETWEDADNQQVQTDNGSGETQEGLGVETEVPDITLVLDPGETSQESENAPAWFQEDTLSIPEWIRRQDSGTPVWITGDSSTEQDGTVTNITVETTGSDTTYTRRITAPDGTVTEEKATYTRDDQGRITGYHMETAVITPATSIHTAPPENAEIHADGGWTTCDYELPEKPTVPEPEKDADGNVLNGQMVAELRDGNGSVVGYTVVTIQNGMAVHFSDPVMGSLVSTTTKVEPLENGLQKYITTRTRLTKHRHSTSSASVTGGERTVTAQMGEIMGFATIDNDEFMTYMPDLQNQGDGSTDSQTELYNRPSIAAVGYSDTNQYFQWLGEYGIESMIRVRAGDVNTWQPHQFVLEGSDGSKYYVYCADFEVNPQSGAEYNMERIEDADYVAPEAADKIRAIALKGYWGVDNSSTDPALPTPGSLDAFRKMLTDANVLTEAQAAGLTDGMALTATQAAIWYYGNSGSTMLSPEDIVGQYFRGAAGFTETDPAKKAVINSIYTHLIGMEGTPADTGNTLLTVGDFAQQIELTVKERQEDGRYNTDVVLSMAVVLDDTTSDLTVYVSTGGQEIGVYRMSGTPSAGQRMAQRNPDGSYRLSGLLLNGDTPITLNLGGTQNLENGVYLFTCNAGPNGQPSQTFIGAGVSQQSIDMRVDFQFSVTDPVVTVHSANTGREYETLEWTASYHTFRNSDSYEGSSGYRNTSVPKTGDSLFPVQAGLGVGIALCLLLAAVCQYKKERAW